MAIKLLRQTFVSQKKRIKIGKLSWKSETDIENAIYTVLRMKFLEMPGNLSGIRYENMCQKFKFKNQILNPFHSISFPEICVVWISKLLILRY